MKCLFRRVLPATLVALAGLTSVAYAVEPNASGRSEALFFAQLGLLLLIGRGLGEIMQKLGQPAVMGQLLGGVLLGPSILGLVWPDFQHMLFPGTPEQKSMINAVSQLGILMLLLLTGMETDLRLVRRVGRAAIAVAAAGVTLPFICGFALGEMLPDSILPNPQARFVSSLFLATALSISSIKIVAMVVREMNFMRRDVGQIIVASAILEDSSGWIIIAISFGLASSGTIDVRSVTFAILGTLLFLAFSLTVGRRVVFWLIRWTNDNFASEYAVITVILLIMIVMALITYTIGVQTVLGAFVAGVLVGESPILTRHIDQQLRGLIAALFMPVFFGLSGLSADLTILKNPNLLLLAVGLIVIASFGKFAGAFVGGKLGGLNRRESLALACAMNARGSTEVIVASIGLSAGVFSQNLYTLIVGMAVITTLGDAADAALGAAAAAAAARRNASGSSARSSTPAASCRISNACCSLSTGAPTARSRRASAAPSRVRASSRPPSSSSVPDDGRAGRPKNASKSRSERFRRRPRAPSRWQRIRTSKHAARTACAAVTAITDLLISAALSSSLARQFRASECADNLSSRAMISFTLSFRHAVSVPCSASWLSREGRWVAWGVLVNGALTQRRRPRALGQPLGYSMTSSARASSVGGTSSPRALAVFRLITSSYLVGACTGRSAGFSPLRMRSTYSADRRIGSCVSGP